MDSIFRELKAFSQDLNNWNIEKVTMISKMFADSIFNGNISDWNVSHIGSFDEVFKGAIYFNQYISR